MVGTKCLTVRSGVTISVRSALMPTVMTSRASMDCSHRVPDAVQRSSRCSAEPGLYQIESPWPGLPRPSIFFERVLRRKMDARVKPAHDAYCGRYGRETLLA